jgi:hypothetical protein
VPSRQEYSHTGRRCLPGTCHSHVPKREHCHTRGAKARTSKLTPPRLTPHPLPTRDIITRPLLIAPALQHTTSCTQKYASCGERHLLFPPLKKMLLYRVQIELLVFLYFPASLGFARGALVMEPLSPFFAREEFTPVPDPGKLWGASRQPNRRGAKRRRIL